MSLKNYWNKILGTVGGVDDDYETDEYEDEDVTEEEQRQQRRQPVPASRRPGVGDNTYAQPIQPLKMMIVEPETFEDSQSIADYLRDRKPVVINFESTPDDISKRVVDFVSGATYAIDGNIQKVGKDIFLCAPSNITLDRSKRDRHTAEMNEYNPNSPLAWNPGGSDNGTGNTPQ